MLSFAAPSATTVCRTIGPLHTDIIHSGKQKVEDTEGGVIAFGNLHTKTISVFGDPALQVHQAHVMPLMFLQLSLCC
jgi:hypothetical protein